jgi:hypothetical protein
MAKFWRCLLIRIVMKGFSMPLTFRPRAGQIFICDFSGFKEPEMVKRALGLLNCGPFCKR